jgi:hypothetical protein
VEIIILFSILNGLHNSFINFLQAGALKSEQWRSKVDSLLIVIAMDSFREGSSSEEINGFQKKDPAATAADLQLAALRALLASFLSVSRPPYLSQGLELFRRGTSISMIQYDLFSIIKLLFVYILYLLWFGKMNGMW